MTAKPDPRKDTNRHETAFVWFRVSSWIVIPALLILGALGIVRNSSSQAAVEAHDPSQQSPPQGQSAGAARLEGCVTCHGQIEPMHKYGSTGTLEKLNGDKDAVLLTCTACHG